MMLPEKCFICPSQQEAKTFASWIKSQGDARGLVLHDDTLVVFDSYGATHTDVVRYFNIGRQTNDCLIFHTDGNILSESARHGMPAKDFFSDQNWPFISLVARYLGNLSPRMKKG